MTAEAGLPRSPSQAFARAESLERDGQYAEARRQYEELLRLKDEEVKLLPGAPLVLRRIARCLLEEADFDAAIDCLTAAETSAHAFGDAVGVAHATNLRAIAAQQMGELALAGALYRCARVQAEDAGASALVAMIDQNLGTVANIQGDLDEAKARYRESLRRYRALGLERPMTQVLNNLGMLYTDLGDWRAAEESFADAVRSAGRLSDFAGRLRAETNRIELYIECGRYRKARRLARRLLTLPRDARMPWLGETYKHLGVIARAMSNLTEAERCFRLALSHAERRHDLLLTAETMREIAIVYQKTQRNRETLLALNTAHSLFARLTASRELTDVDRRVKRLEEEFLAIVHQWGSSIEHVDRYTQGHCERVAEYACALATDAGLDEQILLWFRMGAVLHDVGKIMVPAEILNKPGPLSSAEAATMREHPARGEMLIAGVGFPWDIRPMIRHHHERWDGRGYPDRLAGPQIPRAARILCIADVFDALTSSRSYRAAYTMEEAAALMNADAGSVFDPELLAIFLTRTLPRLKSVERQLQRAA
jgi:HD-GYP domain-containing protein (c-di-GMP phosphodiesterase class II)/predicted negative regulator of RcsB-dependent stress response